MFTSIALGPKEVCGAIIGGSCGHYYNPWQQNWTVTLPDKPKPPVKPLPEPKVSVCTICLYVVAVTNYLIEVTAVYLKPAFFISLPTS